MRPQNGKQKLLLAAINLFESQGYFATTIEQIAVEAGVSKGLVYHYFKSKEMLLETLFIETTNTMESVAIVLDSHNASEDSWSQFIDNFFNYLKQEKKFLKLQLTLMLMPELQEIVREPTKKRSDILLTILISWLEKAEVVDSEGAGRLLLATLDGMALHYLSTFDNYPLSSMKHYLLQIVDQLLSNTDMRNFKRNS